MTGNGVIQIVFFFVVLIAVGLPLGAYMARVYEGEARIAQRVLGPLERFFYKLGGVRADDDMGWKRYAFAVLVFNFAGLVLVWLIERAQGVLPLNPAGLSAVDPNVAWNTAVSFATNTNWQAYGGETTMSYFTQMLALTVQNFVSAATGIAVLVAVIRGFVRQQADGIGNFWVDLTKATLYILLPLSIVLALFLVTQGVVQTFDGAPTAQLLDPTVTADGQTVVDQILAVGPAASQIAIKQLGTNGGGFFNVNSAHPFENPTALANFFEMLSILVISGALCFSFGRMVKDKRQGVALFVAMLVLVLPLVFMTALAEQTTDTVVSQPGVDQVASELQPGGNMEGKEARFGITNSAIWATATTAASNGSVNSMHDSYTALGGMVPMFLMQLGEVAFGGVGSGLYGMLAFAVIAVFMAGLMVGRTPEYLGKKLEAKETKMAALTILGPSVVVLIATAIACMLPGESRPSPDGPLNNPGVHGFSEILYAFTSMGNNNGSAFAGLTASGTFYSLVGGLAMLVGRFVPMLAMLALAGSLAKKKKVPPSSGTLPTHGTLFVVLLVGAVVLVGALTFIPALALGPVAEHLQHVTTVAP